MLDATFMNDVNYKRGTNFTRKKESSPCGLKDFGYALYPIARKVALVSPSR
jgi:hypothetical protein